MLPVAGAGADAPRRVHCGPESGAAAGLVGSAQDAKWSSVAGALVPGRIFPLLKHLRRRVRRDSGFVFDSGLTPRRGPGRRSAWAVREAGPHGRVAVTPGACCLIDIIVKST